MERFGNFDWRTYLDIYPDLGRPKVLARWAAAWHWLAFGRWEGRCFPRLREPGVFPEEGGIDREAILARLGEARVPVVVCIDVEPDGFPAGVRAPAPWTGFAAAVDCVGRLRDGLSAATGRDARFCWFCRLDPQIEGHYGRAEYLFERFAAVWPALRAAGDEIAVHVHAYRGGDDRSRWRSGYGDPEWVDHCIGTGFAAYRRVFGRPPESHRFGDRWLSDRALATVARLGARYDLTLEPGHFGRPAAPEADPSGALFPDLRGIPRTPYRWDGNDFRAPSSPGARSGLWLVPLSTGQLGAGAAAASRPALSLNLGLEPRAFRQLTRQVLDRPARPLLALVVSTEIMSHPFFAGVVRNNLAYLGGHFAARHFSFVPPGEALELLGLREGAEGGRSREAVHD